MVSRKEDKVDFDKLEKELANAVEADQRYWRENDAKLRAVHQNVATYDEFRCDSGYALQAVCLSCTYRKTSDRSPRLLLVHFTLTPGLYPGPGV